MPIKQLDLRVAGSPTATTQVLFARAGQQTAFLCHSHKDRDLALGLQRLLHDQGWDLYIDWQDSTLPDKPDRVTADRIQKKIVDCGWFLVLATANSMASRWCPWELGFADGKKSATRIAIVPTSDGSATHGSEYLDLYRRVDRGVYGGEVELIEPKAIRGKPVKSL